MPLKILKCRMVCVLNEYTHNVFSKDNPLAANIIGTDIIKVKSDAAL